MEQSGGQRGIAYCVVMRLDVCYSHRCLVVPVSAYLKHLRCCRVDVLNLSSFADSEDQPLQAVALAVVVEKGF